jgi:protein-tyrosine-phosphatase
LIVALQSGHKRVIDSQAPHLGARTMLFSYWTTGQGIVDPYMKPDKAHEAAFIAIRTAAFAWVKRLQV